MFSAPGANGLGENVAKPGEFAGLLDALDSGNSQTGDLSNAEGDGTIELSSFGQLNSLMAAAMATPLKPLVTNSAAADSTLTEPGSLAATGTKVGVESNPYQPWQGGGPSLTKAAPGNRPQLSPQLELTSGAPNGAPYKGSEKTSKGPSNPAIAALSAGEIPSPGDRNLGLPSPDPSALSERTEVEVVQPLSLDATTGQPGSPTAESTALPVESGQATRRAEPRESGRRNGDRERFSPSEFSQTAVFLPETATGVTAIATNMQSRQDGIHTQLGELAELQETAGRRSESRTVQSPPLPPWEAAELTALQSSFESTLEQLEENFPLDSVAAQIASAAEPDSGWITVEIQPPELGKLEIMVSKQGDDYLARIVAHEAATGDALSLQREQLIDALGQHGLELKEVQITLDSGSANSRGPDSSPQQFAEDRGQERSGQEQSGPQSKPQPIASGSAPNSSRAIGGGTGSNQVNLLV